MKMKVYKAGAERFDEATIGYYVVLSGDPEDIERLARVVGTEVEVDIRPVMRFQLGDRVDYSAVIGRGVTLQNAEIADGPFLTNGQVTWKLRGKAGVVAEAALSEPGVLPLAVAPNDPRSAAG